MLRIFYISLVAISLASCSQSRLQDDSASAPQRWETHQQAASVYNNWDMQARAVVRLQGEAYNLGIQWREAEGERVILLQAPFGQGVIRLESIAGNQYRLALPDGRVLRNQSPEALLDSVIGWSIPVSGLHYWIRGLPKPVAAYTRRLNEMGTARRLKQDEWSIEYQDYFESTAGLRLPRRIDLTYDQILIRIVIERWQAATFEESQGDLFPEFN
ncbi:MAG: lipoprotein insertase outer membrane protein LolB [Pseudomonadota bacterium]